MNRGSPTHKASRTNTGSHGGASTDGLLFDGVTYHRPRTFKTGVWMLRAAFPLSVLQQSARPLPSLCHIFGSARADEQAFCFAGSVFTLLHYMELEDSATILFADDPDFARATAELILALLQHWRSFSAWFNPKTQKKYCPLASLSPDRMFGQLLEHVRRRSLVPLLTRHAVPIVCDLLSSHGIHLPTAGRSLIKSIATLLDTGDQVVASVGAFAAAFYAGGPLAALGSMLVPPSPPVSEQFALDVLQCIGLTFTQMDNAKRHAPVHSLTSTFVAVGAILKNKKSTAELVIAAVHAFRIACQWCRRVHSLEGAVSSALFAAFESGIPDVVGTLLATLDALSTRSDPRFGHMCSVSASSLCVLVHWMLFLPTAEFPQAASWRAETLAAMLAVRSDRGKSVADLLLAKEFCAETEDRARMRDQLLEYLEHKSVDPAVVSLLRAFLADPRWRISQCGHEACGKPWVSTMKKFARCQTVSYCDKQCQAADWPRHKAACKKPAVPASVT
eukprot:TRINITY_DN1635_c0_g4_i1.p1 TRINITY_DN1635_c0_g4~~TRINITY_DN1635_c0_g4_i1.p1  ORF type:complete len:504 (-),score=64.78 TRINITY_DN1635_c0_g4_i1:24-1535(-)